MRHLSAASLYRPGYRTTGSGRSIDAHARDPVTAPRRILMLVAPSNMSLSVTIGPGGRAFPVSVIWLISRAAVGGHLLHLREGYILT